MTKLWLLIGILVVVSALAGACIGLQTVGAALQGFTRVGPQGFGGPEDVLDRVSACCRFAVVRWEAAQLTRFAFSLAALPPVAEVTDEDLTAVRRFYALTRDIARTEFQINSATTSAQRASLAHQLADLREQQEKLRPATERIIAGLVTQQLQEDGVAQPLPFRPDLVWPPVVFVVQRPPGVLVVSPRTEIRQERLSVLQPGLTDAQVEALERGAEALGWSSVVEPTGGYSTYPTIISNQSDLSFAVNSAAHEWSHTYFFFKPLGRNYFESPEMRSINETVANIIGRETSGRIIARYFPSLPPQPASNNPTARGFDFRREMRETRLETERLLSEGNIAGAEAYMGQRRQFLLEHGYNIRKLNQAYFAFHGTYADSPGSVSPIGPQLDALFQRAGSLRAFVKTVEGVSTLREYDALLRDYGIQETP